MSATHLALDRTERYGGSSCLTQLYVFGVAVLEFKGLFVHALSEAAIASIICPVVILLALLGIVVFCIL